MHTMIMRVFGVLALFASAVQVTPVAAQSSVTESAMAGHTVDWRACGEGFDCGAVIVPADWSQPRGHKITVGLARLPARDPAKKIGTLLHNPGGPGPAIEYLPWNKGNYAELTEWFDVVIFDPRGFGASSGISCPKPAPFLLDWASPDRATYAGFAEENRVFAAGCAQALGALRGGLDSWQVAHDMDAIRVALGERRLTYFGNSYGTVFAQAYVELFGRNIARMYLDSVLDHTDRDLYRWTAAKSATAERNLHGFAQWCATEVSCALHGQDALAVWDRVIARAEREPIPAPGADSAATATLITVQARVHDRKRWADFAIALAEADAGDASRFVPRLPPPPGLLAPDMSRVMYCADFPYGTAHGALEQLESRLRGDVAPRMGWAHAWSTAAVHCAGLPRTNTFAPRPIPPRAVPPILVVSGSDDHTTPPGHGQRVAGQLPGARYLPAAGGHAVYFRGDSCVRQHVHRYLTTGTVPPKDSACQG